MDKNTAIKNTVNKVFQENVQNNEMKLFIFSCFRACENYFKDKLIDASKITQSVQAIKGKYIQQNVVNKEQITQTVGMRVPFIDALNFIQLEVEALLKNNSPITFTPDSEPARYGSSARLMFGAMQLCQDKTEISTRCKQDKLTGLYEVNTDKASNVISTHGIPARAAMVMETDFIRPKR